MSTSSTTTTTTKVTTLTTNGSKTTTTESTSIAPTMTTTTVTTTAATTTTTTTKSSTTTLDYTAIRLFIEQTWRQVKNYDKLLETKIATFNVMLEINSFRRMIFLLPGNDGFDDRAQQKKTLVLPKNTLMIIADL